MRLPEFIIGGERRSGTTSLAKWMEAHPDIYLVPRMDVAHFLDRRLTTRQEPVGFTDDDDRWKAEHPVEDYAALFAPAQERSVAGEKSADYLYWKPAQRRIRRLLPNVKLIFTLRDPVERAWSMYWNEVGKGRETLTFEEAVEREPERLASSEYQKLHLSYVSRGYYARNLQELYRTFSPEQVKIVILEHSYADPKATLRAVYEFLGVDSELGMDRAHVAFNNNWTTRRRDFWTRNTFLSVTERLAVGALTTAVRVLTRDTYRRRRWIVRAEGLFRDTKKDFQMSEETRNSLYRLYEPHIQELEEMMKIRLDVWRPQKRAR